MYVEAREGDSRCLPQSPSALFFKSESRSQPRAPTEKNMTLKNMSSHREEHDLNTLETLPFYIQLALEWVGALILPIRCNTGLLKDSG